MNGQGSTGLSTAPDNAPGRQRMTSPPGPGRPEPPIAAAIPNQETLALTTSSGDLHGKRQATWGVSFQPKE